MNNKIILALIFLIFFQNNKTYGADTAAQITKQFTSTPTAADCLPAINKVQEINVSNEQELACLKAGHKKIWLIDKIKNAEELQALGFGILTYNKFQNIPDHMLIIHTQDALRTALLFEKYLLEDELFKYIQWTHPESLASFLKVSGENNAYAMGSFLGYGEENIPYYYKYNAYRKYYINQLKNNYAKEALSEKIPKFFARSPASLAKEINNWTSTHWEKKLKNDKNNYEKWMKLNQNTSNDNLIKQNEAMNHAILVLNDSSTPIIKIAKKPIISPINQPQTWWKTVAKYATSFALGTAAAYALLTGTKHQSTTK